MTKNKKPKLHRGSSLDEFLEEERKKEKQRKRRRIINYYIPVIIGIIYPIVCLLMISTCGQNVKANTTIHTWQTTDNTKAFTDNSKRIPSKYKDQVEQRNIEGLKDYYKYTPIQNKKEHREKLMKRLEELRSKR